MTGGVAVPFRLATAAVRRTADLRRATRALHAAAKASDALDALRVRFPAAVLGGELLGLMSSQFRQVLQHSTPLLAPPHLRIARAMFAANDGAPRQSHLAEAVPSQSARIASLPDIAAIPSSSRLSNPDSPPNDSSGRSAFDPVTGSASRTSQWDNPAGTTTSTSWPAIAATSPPMRESAVPTGALAAQLREYWDLERKQSSARPTMEARTASSGETHGVGPSPAALPSASAHSSAVTAPLSAAERLRAFVSGSKTPAPATRSLWDAAPPNASEVRSLSESSLALPAGTQNFDFAERLTDALRRQALQHGIDVA